MSFFQSHNQADREELAELFFEIDTNDSGAISRKEVREYLENEGHKDSGDLMKAFDLDKSGVITFEEWCHVLDLDYHQTKPRDVHVPEQCTIISQDMHIRQQRRICQLTMDILEHSKDPKDAVKELKSALDKRFDRLWQSIIIKGQYWAYYSHEPKYSLVFRNGPYIVLLWRTPAY